MNRILVLAPHEDRSARAVTLAGELARRTGAGLTLIRVLEERLGFQSDAAEAGGRSLRELILETETRELEALAEKLRRSDVQVAVEVAWGVPWELVLDRVRRDGFELVIKPASGLNQDGVVFFGSTALHLFRRCPCPVWVVGDDGRLPSRLVAAVDPVQTPRARSAAHRILGWAERVQAWTGAEVEAVSAWLAAGADLLRDSLDEAELKEYVQATHDRVEADLAHLLAERDTPPSSSRLMDGPAETVLPQLANESGVDLIVMGTRGRQDCVGDLLGETAETIIRQVRSSVLTIPPETNLP